jgi:hypothetical protein
MATIVAQLDQIDVQNLGTMNITWQEDEAQLATAWIPLGLNKVALYPKITETNYCGVDFIHFVHLPTTDDSLVPVNDEDIPSIIDYIHFICALKEGGEELKAAMPMLQNFLKQAAKYNAKLLTSHIFRKVLGIPAGGQKDTRLESNEELGR